MPADWIELYRDRAGKFRWRRVALNGRVVSDSGQGYIFKSSAKRAAKREAPGVAIVVLTYTEQ